LNVNKILPAHHINLHSDGTDAGRPISLLINRLKASGYERGRGILIIGLFNLKNGRSGMKNKLPEIGIEPIRGFGPTGF
jgi:hypothetical protein